MNRAVMSFVNKHVTSQIVEGKRVIEIGARNVNGTVRPLIEAYKPECYIATDMVSGRGVDVVCDLYNIFTLYQPKTFDLVVCTEMIEHVPDWKTAINNLKMLCKIGGFIVLTTRSKGFHKHGYPYDFWRYQKEDMEKIFCECGAIIQKDDYAPGIFVFAQRLFTKLAPLNNITLFNINSGKYE